MAGVSFKKKYPKQQWKVNIKASDVASAIIVF